MPIDDLMNRACTIVTRATSGSLDAHGNAILTETTMDTICELQQSARSENPTQTVARDQWRLFLPAGTDLQAGDQVTVGELVLEVDGEPWPVRDPIGGATHHIEATVVRSHARDDQPGGS